MLSSPRDPPLALRLRRPRAADRGGGGLRRGPHRHLLLCEDHLSRPVSFSGDAALIDADGVEGALRSNPCCMGCHASLDPVASALFGFYVASESSADEAERYHATREPYGEAARGLAPEWYGTPIPGLEAMGRATADDPRFAHCAARTAAEVRWRRPLEVDDHDRIEAILAAYQAGGVRFTAALRAAADSPVYRAGSLVADATEAELDRESTLRLLGATRLAPVLEDLTGFTRMEVGYPMLDQDTLGYRVMGGSVDGAQVTRVQTTPGPNWALTLRRAAEGAADAAVERIGEPGTALEGVDLDARPGDPAFDATLDALHWRRYAVRPDAAWRSEVGRSGPPWPMPPTRPPPGGRCRSLGCATRSSWGGEVLTRRQLPVRAGAAGALGLLAGRGGSHRPRVPVRVLCRRLSPTGTTQAEAAD